MRDHATALRLIEEAVTALQAHYAPGKPTFYALEHLRGEVRRVQRTLPHTDEPQAADRA
jgi:hypothetical protein